MTDFEKNESTIYMNVDFIILDKNPLEIPSSDLENIKILKTYINGNEVK